MQFRKSKTDNGGASGAPAVLFIPKAAPIAWLGPVADNLSSPEIQSHLSLSERLAGILAIERARLVEIGR